MTFQAIAVLVTMAFRAGVTVVATGVQTGERLKMAASTSYIQMLAAILAPMFRVAGPNVSHRVPRFARVVALRAAMCPPILVGRFVAVGANVAQPTKVRPRMALKTANFVVLA